MLGPKTKCILKKFTKTNDATLGQTSAISIVQEFSGTFLPATVSEGMNSNRDATYATHHLYVPYSSINVTSRSEVKEANQVEIAGDIYEIKKVMLYLKHHYEIELLRIQ